jgi:hypothetical protein
MESWNGRELSEEEKAAVELYRNYSEHFYPVIYKIEE